MVAVGNRAFPFRCGNNRSLEVFCHFLQGLRRSRRDYASAYPNERVGSVGQDLSGCPNLAAGGRRPGVVLRLHELHVGYLRQRLGWNLDLHGTRAAGLQMVESLVDCLRDLRRVQNPVGPLGHRPDGIDLVVDFVQNAPVHADKVSLNLPGNHQNRRRCGVGGTDAGRRIHESRPRDHQASADSPSGTGEAVGHIGGGLLVPRGYKPDARLIVQGVQRVVQLNTG